MINSGDVEAINEVDVTQETIDGEWERIVSESCADDPVVNTPDVDAPVSSDHSEEQAFAEKVVAAEMVINSALTFVFDGVSGLSIEEQHYARLSHAWAVVVAKRFEGGIFDLMSKYKDEIAAVGASVVFVGVVREGFRVKAEKKRNETIDKNRNRKKAQATDSAGFSETKPDTQGAVRSETSPETQGDNHE